MVNGVFMLVTVVSAIESGVDLDLLIIRAKELQEMREKTKEANR